MKFYWRNHDHRRDSICFFCDRLFAYWLAFEEILIVQITDNKLEKPVKDGLYQVEPVGKKRTNPQNAWIHAYLFPPAAKIMTEKLGVKVSSKMAKAILKARCATDYVRAVDEWIITPTSEMSTVRMSKFIEDCLRYMAEKYHEYIEGPPEP